MSTRALTSFVLLLAVGCGGGNGSGSPYSSVTILTESLEQGNVGHAYLLQCEASGGMEPLTWWVSLDGDPLPAGLVLLPDGRIAGVPTAAGSADVRLVCQDVESSLAVVTLRMQVRDVEIAPDSMPHVDPGSTVSFEATGGIATYSFTLVANRTGGSLTPDGFYTAGADDGVDVVRATDRDGFYEEVSVAVGDDPFIGFKGQYGTTDVWWMDWDVVYSPSQDYASDFDQVLAALGMRRPESTDAEGTEADRLARDLVIRRTLGHMATYYGNASDGTPLPDGLSISFAGPEPPAKGITPTVGNTLPAQPNAYNSICVRYGSTKGVVGTAYLDPGNDTLEHNCGAPTGVPLGVFANRLLEPYLNAFRNSLYGDAVGPADVEGLRAMLYGATPVGEREMAIFDLADNFGRVLGAVLAHEIGHSLGLVHSDASAPAGDLMSSRLTVSRSVTYAFNAEHWAQLLADLPGPNR